MEKRKGTRKIGVTRKRRGRVKKGERNLVSKQFLMCTPQSGPLRDVLGVIQRRQEKTRGRKETEVARRIKGGN